MSQATRSVESAEGEKASWAWCRRELAIYEELSGRENLEFWGRMAGLSSGDAKSRAVELLEALTLTDRAKEA